MRFRDQNGREAMLFLSQATADGFRDSRTAGVNRRRRGDGEKFRGNRANSQSFGNVRGLSMLAQRGRETEL